MDVVEDARRVVTLEHRVAERTGEAVEDRGVHEEVDHAAGERLHQLVADVLDDVAVVAGERLRGGDEIRFVPETERREVEAGRPSLGPLDEDPGDRRVGVDPREGQERGGFRIRHRQVVGVELEQGAVRPEPRQPEARLAPGRERHRGARRDLLGDEAEDLERLLLHDVVDVVEDEHERARRFGEDVAPRRLGRRLGVARLRRLDGPRREEEVRDQDGGVVVHPREPDPGAGRGSSFAHCASNVDLPEPAPASTQIGRSPAVCSPATSRGRSTHSGRTDGDGERRVRRGSPGLRYALSPCASS